MSTQLTDYIPAQVLEREGFVHCSDSEKMLERIDKQFLAERGWLQAAILRGVNVSIRKAAEIVHCSAATLAEYVKMGYLTANDGQISLYDALTFDYPAAKRAYLSTKKRANNRL